MGRPKKNESRAIDRIAEAFWEMLETCDYRDITIKSLSAKARVNHNSIYYYFKSIDDLAERLFAREYESSICNELFAQMVSGSVDLPRLLHAEDDLRKFDHIRLFAASESSHLRSVFISNVRTGWLKHLGIPEDRLSPDDRMDIEFILNGVTAILGSSSPRLDAASLNRFLGRDMGKSIGATFRRIMGSQVGPDALAK